ncbi:hypothetical protein, partial [Alistipes shahii]|uniref:hypothetical protein n=1 Tax=Alistipes shahii TaxID=328814 RepID=UPI003AB19E7E
MTITGCSKDPESLTPDNQDFTLDLIADSQIAGDTRTQFDPVLGNIKWSEGDENAFYVNSVFQRVTASISNNIATFSLSNLTPGTCNIQGYYPSSAYWSAGKNITTADKVTAYAMTLPAAQTATTETFDPKADILIARNMDAVEVTETTKELSVRFGRPVAISKFTYKITNPTLTASAEKVRSVALKVVSEGKYIAGNFYFNPTSSCFVSADGTTQTPHESDAFADNKSSEVVVSLSDQPAVNANFEAWFVTAPVTVEPTDQLVFTITTDGGTVVTKTVTPGKNLQFVNSKLNTLAINIDNTVTIEKADIAIYTCGFETAEGFTSGNNYQGTVTSGKDNMQWQTYYGTPTTNSPPSGATGQNMQCRWYTSAKDKIGYTQMLFDVTKATYVTFDAASTYGIQVKAEYSTDQGATWQNEAIFTLKGTYDVPYKYVISTEGITARVKFSIVLPATAPTKTSNLYLDNVTVYGKEGGHIDIPATITASDIKDIAATGGDFSAANAYEVINSTSNVTATCDGEIVTNAAAAAGTLSYTLAPNYGTEARTGSITLTLADDPTVTKTINVTQKGSVYDVSPASITLGGDSGATAEFTLTSDFEVDAPVVSAPDKFSVSGPVDNVYTVTALADGGAAEAELGTITFTRKGDNGDNKEIVIPVSQVAKGDVGISIAELTSDNMTAMSNAGSGYNTEKTYVDALNNLTWSTNGYQSTSQKNMIQLRVRTNNSGVSWIKLPEFTKEIKKITFVVTNASANSAGGTGAKGLLYFQTTNAKDAAIVLSGGDASNAIKEVVLDFATLTSGYTTGYITASAGFRIWNIKVEY